MPQSWARNFVPCILPSLGRLRRRKDPEVSSGGAQRQNARRVWEFDSRQVQSYDRVTSHCRDPEESCGCRGATDPTVLN